jgi:hypothetical protein
MAACGDDGGGGGEVVVDSGSTNDAGDSGHDATVPKDAAADADAKVNIDAATDAGGGATDIDAAALVDAETGDATAADAGSADDGSTDAGSTDDSSTADAATMDAGSTPVTPTAAGQIVITEIQPAPLGYAADVLGEWVEIYNPSATTTYDLATCTFGDKAGDADYTFTSGTLIAPHGYLALTASVFNVPSQGFVGDAVYGAGSNLGSDADGPNIVCGSVIIDTVEYSAGAGFPVPATMKGRTIQLSPSALDAMQNDLGANWCFGTTQYFTLSVDGGMLTNYGTPKAANVACP